MKKLQVASLAVLCALATATAQGEPIRTITPAEYLDRMQGGWIGQIIGVGWALPTEFKFPSKIVPEDKVPEWKPERIDQHFNDDIFFNVGALQLVDRTGLDAPPLEVAIAWLNSQGRRSGVAFWGRVGIAPPDLAHPRYSGSGKWSYANLHMFSDFAGLVSPGMPGHAADLIDRFTVKSCETRYDGRFVAALTAEAFFERDPQALVRAGLEVIPPDSQYAEAVRDIVRWHAEAPDDWQATWRRIQEKYFENPDYLHGLDPGPGTADAKVHGAYVVLGLLYGGGDLARSVVLTMRCGQDSDCSASNTGGILGVALGASGIPARFTEQLDVKRPFNHVDWNLEQCYEACERLARLAVTRCGGRVDPESWHVADFDYDPGPYMKWWAPPPTEGSVFSDEEMRRLNVVALRWALPKFFPGWTPQNYAWSSSMKWSREGREKVLTLDPQDPARPVVLKSSRAVPDEGPAGLPLAAGGDRPWKLEVRVDGQAVAAHEVGTDASHFWTEAPLDLAPWRGREVTVELAASYTPGTEKADRPDMCLAGLAGPKP